MFGTVLMAMTIWWFFTGGEKADPRDAGWIDYGDF